MFSCFLRKNNFYMPVPDVGGQVENHFSPESTRYCSQCVIPLSWCQCVCDGWVMADWLRRWLQQCAARGVCKIMGCSVQHWHPPHNSLIIGIHPAVSARKDMVSYFLHTNYIFQSSYPVILRVPMPNTNHLQTLESYQKLTQGKILVFWKYTWPSWQKNANPHELSSVFDVNQWIKPISSWWKMLSWRRASVSFYCWDNQKWYISIILGKNLIHVAFDQGLFHHNPLQAFSEVHSSL